jgi:hypothetical protein
MGLVGHSSKCRILNTRVSVNIVVVATAGCDTVRR